MELKQATQGETTIVSISGNLDTNSAAEAENYLKEILDRGSRSILINCEHMDYVSSAGLRVFLSTLKQLGELGGSLKLSDLNDTVGEVFEISGFDTIFDVYKTEAEALG